MTNTAHSLRRLPVRLCRNGSPVGGHLHPWSLFDLFTLLQEEEDGSEEDGDSSTQFTVSVRPELSVLSFLDHMDKEVDGFISPVDEFSPKKTTDMRLSNLHSATT